MHCSPILTEVFGSFVSLIGFVVVMQCARRIWYIIYNGCIICEKERATYFFVSYWLKKFGLVFSNSPILIFLFNSNCSEIMSYYFSDEIVNDTHALISFWWCTIFLSCLNLNFESVRFQCHKGSKS